MDNYCSSLLKTFIVSHLCADQYYSVSFSVTSAVSVL